MADQPSYTKLPNTIIDAMPSLGNAELRVLLAIARKTVGFQKECDRISVSQIAALTGLTTRNTQQAITALLKKDLIAREPAGKQAYCYTLQTMSLGDTDTNHVPSDTISLGDTEPYPVGTQLEVKPYPLGTTQKKDLKERKKEHGGSDPLYAPMFETVARACQIDLKLCTKAQRIQVAQTSKELLKAGKLPEEIPKVERWWYVSDWRGKKGDAPRPGQLIEVWQQAMTGSKNGEHIRQTANGHSERGILREADRDKPF